MTTHDTMVMGRLLAEHLERRPKLRLAIIAASGVVFLTTLLLRLFVDQVFGTSAAQVSEPLLVLVVVAGGTLSFALLSLAGSATSARDDAYRQQIEQAESKLEAAPEKARPAWDLARITLDAYFSRNLGQITYIFWLSVFVMLAGFCLLGWGLATAVAPPAPTNIFAPRQPAPSLLPVAITTGAGIVTEFIGATFLFIYRSTIRQALTYTETLERINSVGMAMQILDTMPERVSEDDLKSRTKALLVEMLVRQTHQSVKSEFQSDNVTLKKSIVPADEKPRASGAG